MSPDAEATKLSPTARLRVRAATSIWFAVAIPPTVATVIGDGCADSQGSPVAGTTTVSSVEEALVTVALTPAIVTAVVVVPRKPVPRTIAVVPGANVAGATDSIVGGVEPSGAITVIESDPVSPSLNAVTVVVPGLVADSCPAASTAATSGADELQVTRPPTRVVPLRSVTTTVSGVLCPAISGPESGVMVTANTGGFSTVTFTEPVFPSTAALIVVEPSAAAVTTPASDTVAMLLFADVQVGAFPVITAPD